MLWLRSRPKSPPENHAERQANTHMLVKFCHHGLYSDCNFFFLLDAASHWGVVGKHPFLSPHRCSA